MKKNTNTILLFLLIFGMQLLAACKDDMPNYYNQREYELQNFTGVELGDALQVEIIKSTEFKVIAKGEDNDINDLELKVESGMLTGNYRHGSRNHKRTLVYVYLPELDEVNMHGATETTIKGFYQEEDSLKLMVSSASQLTMDTELEFLELEVSGASRAMLSGQAAKVQASVSGASELKASGYAVEDFKIAVNGASKATVKVYNALNATVNGSSELKYTGSPELVEREVASDSKMSSF